MKAQLKKTFERGKSIYECLMCGRTTRDTGRGEGSVHMCYQCYQGQLPPAKTGWLVRRLTTMKRVD